MATNRIWKVPITIRCLSCNKFCKRPILAQDMSAEQDYMDVFHLGNGSVKMPVGPQRQHQTVIISALSSCCHGNIKFYAHKNSGIVITEWSLSNSANAIPELEIKFVKL